MGCRYAGRQMARSMHGVSGAPRIGVYIDYRFRRAGGILTAERAFALFLFALAPGCGGLRLIGRLDPAPEPYAYPVPDGVEFTALPFYASLARPLVAAGALLRGAGRLWRALDDVDVVWVLGPNPLAVVLAVAGLARRRRVVLGVRQDMRSYARRRHPDRRAIAWAADALEAAFRLLARVCPVVVVGVELGESYRRARALHVLHVSLVHDEAVVDEGPADRIDFSGRVLSVGRLDAEKNPLLLAAVMADLRRDAEPCWRIDVYGDGPLAAALGQALAAAGSANRATLHGYVPADAGLLGAYAQADALLHVSWTEGMPQVLLEAFAARLPVVATAVGGVPAFAGDAALLIGPGDAGAAAAALRRLAAEPELRRRLADRGTEVVRRHTLEAEAAGLTAFLAGPLR